MYYAINFQKGNPYSNTYNACWNDHLNVKWSNNQGHAQAPQVPQAPQRRPSPLEEAFIDFIKVTQACFEQVGRNQEAMSKNHDTMSKNTKASIKNI